MVDETVPTGLRGDRFCVVVGPNDLTRAELRGLMTRHLVEGVYDGVWTHRTPPAHMGWRRATGTVHDNSNEPRVQVEAGGVRVSTDDDGFEPVFVGRAGPYAIASSELLPIAAAMRVMGVAPQADEEALHDLIVRGYVAGTRCPIRGVRRLSPGESALLMEDGTIEAPQPGAFHSTRGESSIDTSVASNSEELARALRELLGRLVRRSVGKYERTGVWAAADDDASRVLVGLGYEMPEAPRVGHSTAGPAIDEALDTLGLTASKVDTKTPETLTLRRAAMVLSSCVSLDALSKQSDLALWARHADHAVCAGPHSALFAEPELPADPEQAAQSLLGAPEPALLQQALDKEMASAVLSHLESVRSDLAQNMAGPGTDGMSPARSYIVHERDSRWGMAEFLMARLTLPVALPLRDPRIMLLASSAPMPSGDTPSALRETLSSWPLLQGGKAGAASGGFLGWLKGLFGGGAPPEPDSPEETQSWLPSALDTVVEAAAKQGTLEIDGEALRAALQQGGPGSERLAGALLAWSTFWNQVHALPDPNATLDT